MKRLSALYVINKLQIETMTNYQMLIRLARPWILKSPNAGEVVEQQELWNIAKWVEKQNGISTLENSLAVSNKIKYIFTIGYSTFSDIYPKVLKTDSHKNLYMFIATLFIIFKTWNPFLWGDLIKCGKPGNGILVTL
jgi:hypothetical protein